MISKVSELLKSWENILVLSHASPDGDTLGSACALMRGLIKIGKNVSFKCSDSIAPKFAYLFEGIKLGEFEPDKVVAVDVASISLLGDIREEFEGKIDLAIDHHASHINYAEVDFVDSKSAANAEIIYNLLKEMGIEIDKKMADCIYTGTATDTGCFRYRNVTSQTHRIAAEMLDLGADFGDINQIMFETKTKEQNAAEILALSSIEYFLDGKIAMLSITRDLMERTGITDEDLDVFASKPRQIAGVVVGVTLKEKPEGGFKASVRTNAPVNASEICQKLGGGGHMGAAGCVIKDDNIEDAKKKILGACEEYLAEINR